MATGIVLDERDAKRLAFVEGLMVIAATHDVKTLSVDGITIERAESTGPVAIPVLDGEKSEFGDTTGGRDPRRLTEINGDVVDEDAAFIVERRE